MNTLQEATAEHISRLYSPIESSSNWSFDAFVNHRPVRYFSYGRHALYEALRVIGCGHGDSVLLPAFICRDLLSAVNTMGASPLYYNVDRQMQIIESPDTLPSAKAVLAVNYFGFPQSLEPFQQYAARTGAAIIEDNAHGFLSCDNKGKALGTRGDIGIFSIRKTLMLPDGAAMVINTSVKTGPLELQKISKNYISVSFTIKCLLKKMAPPINLRAVRLLTSITRTIRKIITGYEILPSDRDAEYHLPGDSAPCQFLSPALAHLDAAGEIFRRRELYAAIDSIMRNAGYEPVFPSLPPGVAPYAYPFYSPENGISAARRALKQIHLDCFLWPELPDAIRPEAPERYKSIWMINFLW